MMPEKRGTFRVDRALGVFLGGALGDALGAPYEFKSRSLDPVPLHMNGGGSFNWREGETTDDTEMAMGVAKMYLQTNGLYSEQELKANWLAWIDTHPRDVGAWTRHAMGGLRRGQHPKQLWQAAGRKDAGNGGVMRAWVTPLVRRTWKQIERDTVRICELSHPDPRCVASCIAVHSAIHEMIAGRNNLRAIVTKAAIRAREYSEETSDAVVSALVTKPLEFHNSGYTVGTVHSAFTALVTTQSYEDCLRAVCQVGNDADSVGAVAGALAGAYYGYTEIPKELVSKLRGSGSWYHFTEVDYLRTAIRLLSIRN
jgi:ADP-ribosyl-[dinitrogen reductase] hydrolase